MGSGYLKERRAAGLVFCENTASLYRTLFVSPLAVSCILQQFGQTENVIPSEEAFSPSGLWFYLVVM